MWNARKNENGFTVLELLTVLTIIGILVAMASLSMDFVRRERVTSTTRQLLADLQRARLEGMTKAPTDVLLQVRGAGINFISSSAYSSFIFNDSVTVNNVYDGSDEAAEVKQTSLASSVELLIGVGGAIPNNKVLIFDRLGMPHQDNWNPVTNMTILVRDHNNTAYAKCIALSMNRIREGTWNGVACNIQ